MIPPLTYKMAMSSLATKLGSTSFALARNATSKGQMVKQVCGKKTERFV